jgi:hypothetical protein
MAELEGADSQADQVCDLQPDQLAHAADLAVTAFGEDEAEAAVGLQCNFGGPELAAVEFESVAEPGDGVAVHAAGNGDEVFLLERGLGADDDFREDAVFREDQQAVAVLVEAAERGEAGARIEIVWGLADKVFRADQAGGGDLVAFWLGRDIANGLVDHDGDLAVELCTGAIIQRERLAGFDLAADIGDALAIDDDGTFGDQRFGFAARADAGLRQPLVDALGSSPV